MILMSPPELGLMRNGTWIHCQQRAVSGWSWLSVPFLERLPDRWLGEGFHRLKKCAFRARSRGPVVCPDEFSQAVSSCPPRLPEGGEMGVTPLATQTQVGWWQMEGRNKAYGWLPVYPSILISAFA